ncbi:copper resistance CopC family protein [Allobranchiibius sp. GilTou73]|uniref:copper resistance CopC family protein n=1 Tax=Allobranchiibius sp. GilTou73 TaxID=2904523 RepID=UPI001F3A8491|nr:copper resistance CopC family protein [Allobranchiibius sp. GilTou73]UIJ33944.1 copper resistance protein CopC [Allobranchiibius sp. GilTou73]
MRHRGGKGRRTAVTRCAAVVLTVLLIGGVVPVASAHDYLVSSTPGANSTVRSQPGSIALTFDDVVLNSPVIRNRVRVTGPGGRFYETGCPTVLGRVVTVPAQLGAGGRYDVEWRIVSADGHPVTSSISFTYQPRAGTRAASGTTGTTCATSTTQAASATKATTANGSSRAPLLVGGGIVVVTVLSLVLLFVRRRPRAAEAVEEEGDSSD